MSEEPALRPAAAIGARGALRIRDARPDDAAALALIYNPYVSDSVATFEVDAVHPSVMADRVGQCQGAGLPWLLAEDGGRVQGYAYAVRWKPRRAYARSCETTIYLDPDCVERGIGRRLYGALLERVARAGFHAAMGGIALPNAASVALHESLGFDKVAHFREVGYKQGRWIDVGYWQRILDEG